MEQTNNELIQVLLTDLQDIQTDVLEIKRLLNSGDDVKFISFAARVEAILNTIKRLITGSTEELTVKHFDNMTGHEIKINE